MSDFILQQLYKIVAEVFLVDASTMTRATVAADVNGWDSVTHTILMLELENQFGIEIPLEATYKLQNLGELADYISARQSDFQ